MKQFEQPRDDEPRDLDPPTAQPAPPSWKSIIISSPARWRQKPLAARLSAALVVVAIAFLFRLAILGPDQARLTYLTFYPGVAIASLFGGAITGTMTAIVSAFIAFLLIDPPNEPIDWLGLALFLGGAALIVASAELLGRADAETKVAQTLDTITSAVFAVDRNFNVTFVNRESERISGRRRDELVGRSVWDCIPTARGSGFQRRCESVMETGVSINCEEYNAPMNRWFDVNICSAENGIAVNFHDITARKRAIVALRDSEERLRLALGSGKIGTWQWQASTNQTVWDARACEIYGHPLGEPASREMFLERLHPEDRAKTQQAIDTSFANRGKYEADYRVIVDGRVRWVASRGTVSVDADGTPQRLIGVCYDITESKSRERNLAFSADLQKAFNVATTADETMRVASGMIAEHLELTHCAFATIDPGHDTCTVVYDHHAPATPDLRGDYPVRHFLTDKEREQLSAGVAIVIKDIACDLRSASNAERFAALGIRSMVGASHLSNGDWKFALLAARSTPSSWPQADVELLDDLAARVFLRVEKARSEAALVESQQRLDLALSGAGLGVWDWNVATNAVRFDERWGAMIGYASEEVDGNFAFWQSRVHPDDLPRILSVVTAHLNGRTESFAAEHRLRHKSGNWVWILSCGRVFERSLRGEPLRAVGVHVDISAQKRTESALREREELLRAATDHASVGLVSLDLDQRYTFANPAFAKILGLGAVDLIGKRPAEVLPQVYQSEISPNLDRAFAGERVSFESKRPGPNGHSGKLNHFSVVYEPERDASGRVTGVVVVIFDITERKRAEERQALLIRELDHRVKNVLALMSVVIARSREGASSIDGFLNAIEGRIHSMAKTHSRLSRNQWTGVSLAALVGDELGPYRTAHNTLVTGDGIELGPEAAQVVSMVLHELATNAAKYGALASTDGRVVVSWGEHDRDGVRALVLTWQELGVGGLMPPSRESYGTEVIRQLVRYELGGSVQLTFGPEGVWAEFVIPSARAVARRR